MKTTKTKLESRKLKVTYLLLGFAAVAAISGYGWHVYSLFRDWQFNTPQSQVERLIRDLRRYQAQTNHFPTSFTEINELLWQTQPKPDYGVDGRQARVKHYYYYYTRVEQQKCVLWALPLGPQRQYAASFFVVITPNWMRGWKGKALADDVIGKVPAIPSPGDLATLSMREIPVHVSTNGK